MWSDGAIVLSLTIEEAWTDSWRWLRIIPIATPESRYAPLRYKMLPILYRIRVWLVWVDCHFCQLLLLVPSGSVSVSVVKQGTLPSDIGVVLILTIRLLPISRKHFRLRGDFLAVVFVVHDNLLLRLVRTVQIWVKTWPQTLMNLWRLWHRNTH